MNFEDIKKYIEDTYIVVEYNNGHVKTIGKDANIMKNPFWKIKENDNETILMYCETTTLIKLCQKSLDKILDYEKSLNNTKLTWYKGLNGYNQTHNSADGKVYYIHQIITGCYGNGKGTKNISVDHIDRDPLNNTLDNLRIATREEQEQNSKGIKTGTKRERKHDAQNLPDGITQEMIKKY